MKGFRLLPSRTRPRSLGWRLWARATRLETPRLFAILAGTNLDTRLAQALILAGTNLDTRLAQVLGGGL